MQNIRLHEQLTSMDDGKYGEDETVAVCDIHWPSETGGIRVLLHRSGWILNHTEIESREVSELC